MPYFLLGLAVVVGVYLIYLGMKRSNPQNVRKMLAGVIFAVAFVVLGFLAATGRFGPLGWAVLALPLLMRWRNIAQAMRNMGGPTPGRNSDVETRYLRMTLEHDSGVLRGTVLAGAHKGRNLDEMPLDDLLDLLRECRVNDPESATILESYLDRVHGADWRGAGGGDDAGTGGGRARASSGGMTREQAYEILGLEPGASPDEIREAHRNLLKANHPDRGGSTWLAAQINLAKDILLPGN
jgi:hypothetical protein